MQLSEQFLILLHYLIIVILSLVKPDSVLRLCNCVVKTRTLKFFFVDVAAAPRGSCKKSQLFALMLISLPRHDCRNLVKQIHVVFLDLIKVLFLVELRACIASALNVISITDLSYRFNDC